ncbi:MAG: phosphotransferase [Deinococcota bacterium]
MLPNNLPVPASEVDISPAWLSAVLAGAFPEETFVGLEHSLIGQDYGFASRIIRCQWRERQWREHHQPKHRQHSVVIKLWSTDSRAGTTEVQFYQTFRDSQGLGVRVPKCYYSAVDKQAARTVLVLEDLQGAIQGDVLEPLDLESAKAVARSLAKLHTMWLDHSQLTEMTWIPDMSVWQQNSDWFEDRRRLFLERFPKALTGVARTWLDRLEHAPQLANARLTAAPKTLLHGDFHLDNLMFVNQQPIFLDWSKPVRGPLALNLAVLLFQMTSLDYFDEVLACYLDSFAKISSYELEYADVNKQLGGALLRLFATSTCGVARWQPELARAQQIIQHNIDQLNTALAFWQDRNPDLWINLK